MFQSLIVAIVFVIALVSDLAVAQVGVTVRGTDVFTLRDGELVNDVLVQDDATFVLDGGSIERWLAIRSGTITLADRGTAILRRGDGIARVSAGVDSTFILDGANIGTAGWPWLTERVELRGKTRLLSGGIGGDLVDINVDNLELGRVGITGGSVNFYGNQFVRGDGTFISVTDSVHINGDVSLQLNGEFFFGKSVIIEGKLELVGGRLGNSRLGSAGVYGELIISDGQIDAGDYQILGSGMMELLGGWSIGSVSELPSVFRLGDDASLTIEALSVTTETGVIWSTPGLYSVGAEDSFFADSSGLFRVNAIGGGVYDLSMDIVREWRGTLTFRIIPPAPSAALMAFACGIGVWTRRASRR